MTEDKECLSQLQRGGREQSSSFVLPEGTCCSLHICFLLDKQEHYNHCCVVSDPDSIMTLNPDTDFETRSGSRKLGKWPTENK
jgi:hypothetical protein